MARTKANLWRRLEQLERRAPASLEVPSLDPEAEKRLERTLGRLQHLMVAAGELMSEEEVQQVTQALAEWNADERGPFADWMHDLMWERSCVPEMPAEAMRTLLLAWLSPERSTFSRVCRHCGLEYPDHRYPPHSEWKVLPGKVPLEGEPPWYDLPDFFTACPGCGASVREFDWAHLIGNDAPWKATWK